jgi:hypothetical protein
MMEPRNSSRVRTDKVRTMQAVNQIVLTAAVFRMTAEFHFGLFYEPKVLDQCFAHMWQAETETPGNLRNELCCRSR